MSVLNSNHNSSASVDDEQEVPRAQEGVQVPPEKLAPPSPPLEGPAAKRIQEFATREAATGKQGFDKKNLLLVGGAIGVALLFFLFAQLQSKKPVRKPQIADTQKTQPQAPKEKASITPNMEPFQNKPNDINNDRVSINDIERTRQSGGKRDNTSTTPPPPQHPSKPLASVPPFKDTQQTWTEPQPYGSPQPTVAAQQEQNALKEASLVFVKSPQENAVSHASAQTDSDEPVLQLNEGTRIQAHLESEASSAIHIPVVAVVDYTYAIGDQVLVPAGARIFGKMTQADSSGNAGIDFTEIEIQDKREKISAVGAGLDMGPIKGNVYGKHEGRNFLIRAASGLASTAAMVVGNNVTGAYSEADMIRERAAANIGMAGDMQLQLLNASTHLIVAVPANTEIYVVWTKRTASSDGAAQKTP
jgi:hypothetical protein